MCAGGAVSFFSDRLTRFEMSPAGAVCICILPGAAVDDDPVTEAQWLTQGEAMTLYVVREPTAPAPTSTDVIRTHEDFMWALLAGETVGTYDENGVELANRRLVDGFVVDGDGQRSSVPYCTDRYTYRIRPKDPDAMTVEELREEVRRRRAAAR